MLEIKNLSAGYPGRAVLKNVSMSLPSGKVTVILGPNGCGKSTLLKVLCGILPITVGEVTLDGQAIPELPSRALAQKISYLAQSRQIPDITVQRMVLHGRFPYLTYPRHYRQEDYDAANAAMAQMNITDLADTLLQNLSGGQRQKVYIAMALAQNTQVILLDEPTTYLDVAHQLQMMHQAKLLSNKGKTVVMVLHDLSLAMHVADQVIVMNDGEVAAAGEPQTVFNAGSINSVFGVKLGRIKTESGWHYYYEEAD